MFSPHCQVPIHAAKSARRLRPVRQASNLIARLQQPAQRNRLMNYSDCRASRNGYLMVLLLFLSGPVLAKASAADWPGWRGPAGTGVSAEQNLPVRWSPTQNVGWKVAIGGAGVSQPIV